MPLYDFRCKDCGSVKEIKLEQFDSPIPACECGGTNERLLCAPTGFVFKGGGTYDKGYVSKTAPK